MADEKQEEMPPADTANPDWGDDITPSKDGGLFKSILTAGHGVEHPLHGDEVSVHYTGRLLTGEVFDSSVERGELFKFKLGQNQVIKGWDVGVATMVKGEKCILTCKPDYAYGSAGSPPKIPPDATLQFEVELFDWYGEDLTGDGGIVKSIISKGDGYSKPTDGAQVEGVLIQCPACLNLVCSFLFFQLIFEGRTKAVLSRKGTSALSTEKVIKSTSLRGACIPFP